MSPGTALGVKLRSLVELEGRLLDLEDRVKQSPPDAASGRGAYP